MLQALVRRVERTCSRRGRLALGLVGEPGIGKTHLGRQLMAGVNAFKLTLPARAYETGFAALRQVQDGPVWAQRTLERSLAGQSVEAVGLASAVGALLGKVAPAVVWAEDFHEVGEPAAEFWAALARSLPAGLGVALILSSRTPLPAAFSEQRLTPLTQTEARELLAEQAGGPLPPAALKWIEERGHGNPLFLMEFFRFLSRSGALYRDAAERRWHWREPLTAALPMGVEALIAEHLTRLSSGTDHPHAERLLGLWALWDSALPAEALSVELAAHLSGLSAAQSAALDAVGQASGVRTAEGFAHPLFREVALRELPQSTRRELARRCAQALTDQPEQAAAFLKWAEWPAAEVAARLNSALGSAQARGALRRVATYLDALVDVVPAQERAGAALAAAAALQAIHTERALTRARQAQALEPGRPEALYLCARLLAQSGRGQEAERLLSEAPSPISLQPEYWATLLETRVSAANFSGVMQVWQAHAAELERWPLLQTGVALARVRLGEPEAAVAGIREALSRSTDAGEQVALLHALSRAQIAQADPEMLSSMARALAIAAEAGLNGLRSEILLDRTRVLTWAAQLRGAAADASEAVCLAEAQGDLRLLARAQSDLANCLTNLGEFEQAEELLLGALEVLGSEEASRYTVLTQLYLTNLYLEWARPPDALLALRHARKTLKLAREIHDTTFLTWMLSIVAWAEAVHGDLERAEALIEEGETLIRRSGQRATQPFYSFARGFVLERQQHPEAAAEMFDAAYQQAAALRMLNYAERFGLEADRLRGDRARAETRLAFFQDHQLLGAAHTALAYFPPLQGTASPPPAPSAPLRLEVLGEVRVTLAGQPLAFNSPRGLRLLVRLLEARLAGRPGLAQAELLDLLYPDDDPQRSAAKLRQQVHRLRSVLGASSIVGRQSALGSADGYALGQLSSDAEDFLKTREPQLWRGAYLAGLDDDLSSARDVLLYGLRSAAFTAGTHDPREAARLGRIVLEMEPFDWPALSMTLTSLRESGEIMALLSVYAEVRQRCALIGERLPETWEDFLETQQMSVL